MAEISSDIDLSTFSKIRPLTVDDLRRYSAADLDPHTIQVGQILCKEFHFSSQGLRNLSGAFDSLPSNLWNQTDFEIGFGTHHIIHSILKSDDGFALAAIVGSLAEYFHEDIIVAFFLHLSDQSGLPVAWRPIEHQWRRMVSVLYGVLATSSFGILLSTVEASGATAVDPRTNVSVKSLLVSLRRLSEACQSKGASTKLGAAGESVWLAAVAEWLFGLRVAIVSQTPTVVYSSPAGTSTGETNVTIEIMPTQPGTDISLLSISEEQVAPNSVLGGRVAFEHLFRICFGQPFLDIPEDSLAACICCASTVVRHRLDAEKPDWARGFLSQQSASSGGQSVGLAETLSAWFPELQRLSPRFRKYAKLSFDEAKATYDATYRSLQNRCNCPRCTAPNPTAQTPHPEQCSVLITEFLVGFSLILARIFVAPRLLPKKHGVIALLKRWADFFSPYRAEHEATAPSEIYLPHVGGFVSTSVNMIKLAAIVFANSTSPQIEAAENLMGITHCGLTIFSTGAKDVAGVAPGDVTGKTETRWKSAIQVSPGWLCLFGHEAKMEVYEATYGGPAMAELDQVLDTPEDLERIRQILKWKGRTMLSSIVWKGSEEEKMAAKDGWSGLHLEHE